ncbi:hypothetical protein RchiOBHm_Chr1g0318631 [Rosa chinensis]|uniref:Uncharacterized protein n=1 Tax=Rosa chinensis TaxID=74649 RepID=A0A2P6S8A5_ROSCH|nr:hypothetical protein RchiOBHm_Chr1g0318631 [Rosa chinensis]
MILWPPMKKPSFFLEFRPFWTFDCLVLQLLNYFGQQRYSYFGVSDFIVLVPLMTKRQTLFHAIANMSLISFYIGHVMEWLKAELHMFNRGRPTCAFESKWKTLSRSLPRKRKDDNKVEQVNDLSLPLLQHRQAALNRVKGIFDCTHLEIDWKLNPL